MNAYNKNLISESAGILTAMQKLNEVPETLTLFVLDINQRMVGTLTDGDIRRGLVSGLTLADPISMFMSRNFHKVGKDFSIQDFKHVRELGIRLLPVLDDNQRITKIYDLRIHKSILPLECVIMAGGRGERLRPLTDTTPKPMLQLGDKPIIEHNIDRLISFGIEKFYITIKYLGQQIIDYLGDGSSRGVSIEYIWEDQPLGTAGALTLIGNLTRKHILLMNSDLFTNANIEDLYLSFIKNNAVMGVATVPYITKVPFGIFDTTENKITGLKEKPVFTNYANAGIYIFDRDVIKRIPENTFFNVTDLIESLLEDNLPIIHSPIVGYWIDIGQHQDYKNAREFVMHLTNGS